MMSNITTFLKNFKVLKGEDITHTSMGYPSGSFYIPYDENSNFMKIYMAEYENGSNLHLTEKHKSISPILIDLDFRYEKSSTEVRRVYSLEHLKNFMLLYMKTLNEYVIFKEEPNIYIMEKPSPKYDEEKRLIKDGVHIMIPNVVTTPSVQFRIRTIVLEHLGDIFDDCHFINDKYDIFDESVISKNNWLMYGSCKPNGIPYKVTHKFNYQNEDLVNDTNIPDNKSLISILSIRNKMFKNDIKNDKLEEIENMENTSIEEERKKITMMVVTQSVQNNSVKTTEDINIIREFINILSTKRCESYDDWIRLGWCLRNIDNSLLDDWIDFSRRSSKYKEGECENLWNKMKDGGLGIKTLYMWAKNDNQEEYDEILKKSGKALLDMAFNTGLDWDIGKYVEHCYKNDYRCTDIKNNTWFRFENHRWRKSQDAFVLRNNLSIDIYNTFNDRLLSWTEEWKIRNQHSENNSDKDMKKSSEYKNKVKIVNNFKNATYKNKLIGKGCCADIFHQSAEQEDFDKSLDSYPNLLCFNNGVYDLDCGEFREGRPDDYISLCTNIDYVEYDENEPVYEEINKFLAEVQPDDEKREYILRTLANSLHGSNREEKVYFWTGEGGNGKSKLYSLLENCMGDYAANISVSYITSKRAASNSASPEMMQAIGRRFVVFQEPEPNEKVNVGIMKEISGKDTIQCRGLYKDADSFVPQFQVIFICNQLPSLPPDDGGTWRRVRKITFDSKFVDDPNPENPNEFKIDQDLDKKWPEWKVPFMSLLIHYYNKFKDVPNKEPQEVIDATKEYQHGNDVYAEFIETHVENYMNPPNPMTFTELFAEFKEYCQLWSKGKEIQKSGDLQKSIERIYGKPNKTKGKLIWKHLKLNKVSSTQRANEMMFTEDDE